MQNDAPVEFPNHVLVRTSTNGDRTPPFTFPTPSSTGDPFSTWINADAGGAIPFLTHKSRFCKIALNAPLLGNRLRAPSLHSIGGTSRLALTISAGAAAKLNSSGVACPDPAI